MFFLGIFLFIYLFIFCMRFSAWMKRKSFKQFSQIWHQMYYMLFFCKLYVFNHFGRSLMLASILFCTLSVFLWQEGKFRNKWCNSWAKCYYTAKISPKYCYCREHFQNALSRPALFYSFYILGMDKKKTKRGYKLIGLIGVLSGTSMLHEGHSQSRAKLDPTPHQVRVSNSIQTRIWKKLSMNLGQTFLLKGWLVGCVEA